MFAVERPPLLSIFICLEIWRCGSKICTRNGSLVDGMDQNLRSPGNLIRRPAENMHGSRQLLRWLLQGSVQALGNPRQVNRERRKKNMKTEQMKQQTVQSIESRSETKTAKDKRRNSGLPKRGAKTSARPHGTCEVPWKNCSPTDKGKHRKMGVWSISG